MKKLDFVKSGVHLEIIRTWMQHNAINGSHVHWGSDEILNLRCISVADLEFLAQKIANAVEYETLRTLK